jgi:hypothetical protein
MLSYFTPFRYDTPARAPGCLTCTNFLGRYYCGHVVWGREKAFKVVGVPSMGCAFWERERGADNE